MRAPAAAGGGAVSALGSVLAPRVPCCGGYFGSVLGSPSAALAGRSRLGLEWTVNPRQPLPFLSGCARASARNNASDQVFGASVPVFLIGFRQPKLHSGVNGLCACLYAASSFNPTDNKVLNSGLKGDSFMQAIK